MNIDKEVAKLYLSIDWCEGKIDFWELIDEEARLDMIMGE